MAGWSVEQAEVAHWDAAVAGNSALREAFVRALEDEVHTRLQIPRGHALWDIASFYVSIEFQPLAECALEKGFPPVISFLELQLCLAPRMLEQLSCFSEPFEVTRSVVQGLRNGTRFAKCIAANICRRLCNSFSALRERIWIYDLPQRVS
eukprot:4961860-Pyramimonas_sp.AAC.1